VAGFQPSAADLDYPGKLLRLAQAPPPDGAAAAAGREGTDAAQQPDERAPLVQDGGASEDAQVGTWRPPLRCAAGACRARQHIRGQVRLTMRGERPYVKALVRSAARVRLSARRRSASGPPVAAVPQEGASPDRRARARAQRESAPDARAAWYPPVQRTLGCLSRLYRCVEHRVFAGLAQDAVASCAAAVQARAPAPPRSGCRTSQPPRIRLTQSVSQYVVHARPLTLRATLCTSPAAFVTSCLRREHPR